MAYDAATGQLILIDGFPDSNPLLPSLTWDWNGTTWTQLSPATSPPPRSSGSLAYDPADSSLVLFGGDGSDGYLQDTWTWDGSTWSEQSPATSPPAREDAAMAYDPSTSQLVMYSGIGTPAGENSSQPLLDTWTWDGTTWTEQAPVTTPSLTPAGSTPEEVVSLSYDQASSQLVLFAGNTNAPAQEVSDTWLWSGSDWSDDTPTPTSPAADSAESMAYDVATSQMITVSDGETFSWADGTWTDLNPSEEPPGVGSLAYDNATGQLIWFEQNQNPYFDPNISTWSWNGTDWGQLSPASSPPLADGAGSLAYDSSSGQLVFVASYASGTTSLQQTWTWDGATWTEQSPAVSPPALSDTSMGYDPVSGDLILFGGFSTTTSQPSAEAGTWAWDGTTWAQLAPATSPPPNADASFADDPATGELLMFGGNQYCDSSCANPTDATWAWNGSTWSELALPQNPSARSFAGLGWDPATQQMLLTGGDLENLDLYYPARADTWVLSTSSMAAPQITSVSAFNEDATITWSPAALGSGVVVDSYTITSSPGGLSYNWPAGEDSAVFNGLTNGVSYTFTVTPVNQFGTYPSSPPSAAVTPYGAPDEPTNVLGTCGDETATVSWDAPAPEAGEGPVTGYVVSVPGEPSLTPVTVGADTTSVVLTGLVNDEGPIGFMVSAVNAYGESWGARSPYIDDCIPYSAVTAPTILSLVAGDQQATLTWSPSQVEAGGPITGYEIFYNYGTITVGPDVTSAVVSGLTNGTAYGFEVTALTADGPGPPDSGASWVEPSPPSEVPSLTGAKAVKQQVTLAWKPPASKAGGTIVGYQINDSQGLAVTVAATARSHIVKGLSKNGKYKFTVSAVRKPGQQKAVGPPSAPKTVTIS